MVAKVIAWGEDRAIARRRLVRALEATALLGLPNNREFLLDVLGKPDFIDGKATTAFIADHYGAQPAAAIEASVQHLALAACLLYRQARSEARAIAVSALPAMDGYTGARALRNHYRFGAGDQAIDVLVEEPAPGDFQVQVGDQCLSLQWVDETGNSARVLLDGVQLTARYCLPARGQAQVQLRGEAVAVTDAFALASADAPTAGSGTIVAPMHGNLMSLFVQPGDRVSVGQDVAVIEAMKMEHRLSSPVSGEVIAVHVAEGEQVASAAIVLEIAAEE